jgi:hypothetical protein
MRGASAFSCSAPFTFLLLGDLSRNVVMIGLLHGILHKLSTYIME